MTYNGPKRPWAALLLALGSPMLAPAAGLAGTIRIDFEDVDADVPPGVPVMDEGFSIVATNVMLLNEMSDGTNVFAGEKGLTPIGPAAIVMTRDDGLPFALCTTNLAWAFAGDSLFFNTFPTVTFTGIRTDSSMVTQTFVVDMMLMTDSNGNPVNAFQNFTFSSDFTDLVSVSWEQPMFPDPPDPDEQPLHQFGPFEATVIPEPSTATLLGLGAGLLGLGLARRRR